jgi:hypothetical protein
MEIRHYGIGLAFNDISFLPSFMKNGQVVGKLTLWGIQVGIAYAGFLFRKHTSPRGIECFVIRNRKINLKY